MARDKEYIAELKKLTDHELYELAKKFIVQSHIGFNQNNWKQNLVYAECMSRNEAIYINAIEDAVQSIGKIETVTDELTISEMSRLSLMTEFELSSLTSKLVRTGEQLQKPVKSNDISDFRTLFGLRKEDLFFCRVNGLSMIEAEIHDGDTLIVEKNTDPQHGDVVVATINDIMFVKKFTKIDGVVWLVSANKDFMPVKITGDLDLNIFGTVRSVLHKLNS